MDGPRIPCQVRPSAVCFSAEIGFNAYLVTVDHDTLCCKDTIPIAPSLLIYRVLDLTDIGFCLLGICLPYHRSPRASHPLDSGSR